MTGRIGPDNNGKDFPSLHKNVRRGELIRADRWNTLTDALNRGTSGVDGPLNDSDLGKGRAALFRLFKIRVIDIDTLYCVEFINGEEGTEEFTVAKPPLLRGNLASHNSITFTSVSNVSRTADDGTDTETQVVVPAYVVDDLIVGIRGIFGGSNLFDVDGEAIEWMDLNVDARAWAKEA